jgi:prepilin-type processing-associated H-X9-DG protein
MGGYNCTAGSGNCGTNSSFDAGKGSTSLTAANPVGVHSGFANWLMTDGHVKWLPSNQVAGGLNAQTATSPERAAAGADAEGSQVGLHQVTFSFN